MDDKTFPGVIFPDFFYALINELEAVKNTVGYISVGEYDEAQWYRLPIQTSNVVSWLAWCRKQNDRAALDQYFHYDQDYVALLHVEAKALQALIIQEYGKGPFSAFQEARLKPWSDLLVLIDALLKNVRYLLDDLEQHRQTAKLHIAAMRQMLEG